MIDSSDSKVCKKRQDNFRRQKRLGGVIVAGASMAGLLLPAGALGIASVFLLAHKVHCKSSADTSRKKHVLEDDGNKVESFALARKNLLSAIEKKDKAGLESVLSPNIVTALGGGTGKSNFIEQWQGLQPSSKLWNRLERVLAHGAQYDSESEEFHAPAVAFDDSHSELPQAVVWNKEARLYKTKDDRCPETANYGEQVSIIDPPDRTPVDNGWVRVRTGNGTERFMKSQDIYSGFDEFAVFKKVDEKWVLSWFGFAEL